MELHFDTHGNEKQKEVAKYWLNDTTSDIVYGGSKGSGKSYLGASLIFGDAFIYPGTHYFIARVSLTNLRKFTIPTIHEVFKHWGIKQSMYRFNGQDNYFKLSNDSRVLLLDASFLPSDPQYMRFGSMQMTRGMIEEAGEFDEAAKNNLQASIGRWNNDKYNLYPKLLQTCNPAKNYLYREYYRKHKEGTLEIWKRFVQALPQDNKMLDKGYLENLERSLANSPNERKRLLEGYWEFDDDPDKLIDYTKILDCFREDVNGKFVDPGNRCITCDLARLGGDRIVKIEWDGFRGTVTFAQKQSLDVTGKWLEDSRIRMVIRKEDVLCDEDGLGGGVIDYEKFRGFVNNSTPLPSPDAPFNDKGKRDPENFDNLKSQCSYRMADRINKNGLFLICTPEIRELIIEEMEQVRQKKLDTDMKKGVLPKDKVKEKLGRSPDFWDAIMMREYFELKPQRGFEGASY